MCVSAADKMQHIGDLHASETNFPYLISRYTSCCWISTLVVGADSSWEVRVKGNLTTRADTGSVNSSPISTMSPIVRLQQGCSHTIRIPGKFTRLVYIVTAK